MNPDILEVPEIQTNVQGGVGLITLNRPKALNALTLPMVRGLLAVLLAWRDDPAVFAVAVRGSNKIGRPGSPEALFGGFCAGGDIRFFHQAAITGDPDLEAFFTQEYTLNHLIHSFPKPYVAFMDGVVMGGGMGISQGASLRIVTERTKMAMPETGIGLFPDVGGGFFLSRCRGNVGEYLALTGDTIGGAQAVAWGLADVCVSSEELAALWEAIQSHNSLASLQHWIATKIIAEGSNFAGASGQIDEGFLLPFGKATPLAIVQSLLGQDALVAHKAASTLRQRSPLMLHVALEQIRRARSMTLADDLRMERDLVHHCFHMRHLGRSGAASETVEGIRALAVDKDHKPVWSPAQLEDVTPGMVAPFFDSPWTADTHPLRALD